MKALRNYLDKIKPNFEEGGKFHAFRSVFDGFEDIPVRAQHHCEIGNAYSRLYRQQTHHVDGGYCVDAGAAVRYV